MKWAWLLASLASALMTALFIATVVYYFLHYSPSWRVIALFTVVVTWAMFTRESFLRFRARP